MQSLSETIGEELEHFQGSSHSHRKKSPNWKWLQTIGKEEEGTIWCICNTARGCGRDCLWGTIFPTVCDLNDNDVSWIGTISFKKEQTKEKKGIMRCTVRLKGTHRGPFSQCSITGTWKWPLSFCHQYAKGKKMALECREQFPQVHSLATVSIIDSQSCHKTGHSLCLSLWGILWGPRRLTSIINH